MSNKLLTIRKVVNQDFHPDTVDASRIIGDSARRLTTIAASKLSKYG